MATRGDVVIESNRSEARAASPAVQQPDVARAPQLGVLDGRHLRHRRHRRQSRALLSVSIVCVGIALLLAAVGQAVVSSDQIRSDVLQGKIAAQVSLAQNYQLLRAELEAPVRIETIAENQLYMVMPSSVTYVVPVKLGQTVAQAHQNPATPSLTGPAKTGTVTRPDRPARPHGRALRPLRTP